MKNRKDMLHAINLSLDYTEEEFPTDLLEKIYKKEIQNKSCVNRMWDYLNNIIYGSSNNSEHNKNNDNKNCDHLDCEDYEDYEKYINDLVYGFLPLIINEYIKISK